MKREMLLKEIATLERKNMELEGQMINLLHFAEIGIRKADRKRTMASGVLIQMHYLGGAEVCKPFVLRDGLSDETITALCADIAYTHDLGMMFKPKGAKG